MKKIGKLIYLLFTFASSYLLSAESVKLVVESTDSIKLKSVAIGTPFIVKVVIDSPEKNYDKSEIKGLENLNIIKVYPTRFEHTFINNKQTRNQTNSYLVQENKLGKVNIGPIILPSGAKSNTEEIEIKLTQENNNDKVKDNKLEVNIDSKSVFIGQKMPIKVIYSTKNPKSKFQNLDLPKVEELKIKLEQDIEEYQKVIDGNTINFAKIKGYIVPKKTGAIVFPALKVKYYKSDTKINRHDPFNVFDNFFGVKKIGNVYSDAVILNVSALPEIGQEVNGVGLFKNVNFSIKKDKVMQFEGISATLSVEGDADLEEIKHPKLKLDNQFKYYEENSYVKDNTKYFEYVIQGLVVGDYIIPEQNFIFFDTNKKKYRKLKTKPISITIEKTNKLIETEKKLESTQNLEISQKDDDLKFNNKISTLKEINYKQIFIPWFLYLIILLIPIIAVLIKKIFFFYYRIYEKKRSAFSKLILYDAKYELKKSYKNKEFEQFYYILNKSLSRFFTGKNELLTDEEIINNFKNFNYDQNIIKTYTVLANNLLNYTIYVPEKITNVDIDMIYKLINNFLDQILNSVNFKKYKAFMIIFFLSYNCLIYSYSENQALEDVFALKKIQKNAYGKLFFDIEKTVDYINKFYEVEQKEHNFFFYLVYSLPILFWQLLLLICFFVLFIFWFNLNDYLKVILIICTIFLFLIIGQITYDQKKIFGIINKHDVLVYIGPGKEYLQKGKLEFLNQVTVNKIDNSWYSVTSPKINGWIESNNVNII